MTPTENLDWLRSESLYTLVCRPALPADTPHVMELTRTIWEGDDYVPLVWKQWLEDYPGRLAVAQYGKQVVGLCKLSRLAPGEWWLQGLRVHPHYEGRGIASHLHDYLLDYWTHSGDGLLRLATASFRAPVQHLCDRTGFKKVAEFTPFMAPVLRSPPAGFTPIAENEVEAAYELVCRSESARLTGGLMDISWEWVSITQERLVEAMRSGRLWWWEHGKGVLAAREGEEHAALVISLVGVDLQELPACLLDFRSLAESAGYERAGWYPPLGVGLEPILAQAGFQRDWDASVYVYEKAHPLAPSGGISGQ